VIENLISLPSQIFRAEQAVIKASWEVSLAKGTLEEKESALILSGEITGKNEGERKAQIKTLSAKERDLVDLRELDLKNAVALLNKLQNEFRAQQSISRLIGGEESA